MYVKDRAEYIQQDESGSSRRKIRQARGVLQKSPHSKFDSPRKYIGRLGQDLGPSVGGNELFGARVEYNKATGHAWE